MDETELDTTCAQLAKQVANEASQRLGKKWRCPADLRKEIIAYALACRSGGETLATISERLGLIESTLARWLRKKKRQERIAPGFRSVAIIPSDQTQPSTHPPFLRLITSTGHTIEGLDLESITYLLKAIR